MTTPANTAPAAEKPPTATDVALVRASFDLIVPVADVAADLFYERLFYLAPSVRRLFPDDTRNQKRKLILMLATCVQGLDDIPALAPQLKALGARHTAYGAKDGTYRLAGDVLMWTLERVLSADFTPAVQRAWRRVYAFIAATMKEGAAEAAVTSAAA